jgi:hypothetical protein
LYVHFVRFASWYLASLTEYKQLTSKIETVQRQLDEINQKLDCIQIEKSGQDLKTGLMRKIESKFGKSIEELLSERKGKTVREIADELGVSKSTVASWSKAYKNYR